MGESFPVPRHQVEQQEKEPMTWLPVTEAVVLAALAQGVGVRLTSEIRERGSLAAIDNDTEVENGRTLLDRLSLPR